MLTVSNVVVQPASAKLLYNEAYLRVSISLALGPCLVPDSRVWSRPTLFMAHETGDAKLFS